MITVNSFVKLRPSFETLIKYPNADCFILVDLRCLEEGAGHFMENILLYSPSTYSMIPLSYVLFNSI
jgi:hypothetical protein